MAHPDSDGAAEMLEGGHRAIATAALRLAELYAGRMQIHARLREQHARAGGDSDQQHASIAAAAGQMLLRNTGDDQLRSVPNGPDGEGEKVRAEAIRDVPLEEFTHAHQQAAQELAGTGTGTGTGTGVTAVDEDAVIRRQFEILESEAFVRAVIDDKEQWEARRIAASAPNPAAHRSEELAAAETWLARTAPADFDLYRATQVDKDTSRAEVAQENLVNRYESIPTTEQRAVTAAPKPGYDTAPARSTRADTLDRSGLERDIIESAMITDLGFGTPAADAVTATATTTARRPATTARSRGAEREHQTLGR